MPRSVEPPVERRKPWKFPPQRRDIGFPSQAAIIDKHCKTAEQIVLFQQAIGKPMVCDRPSGGAAEFFGECGPVTASPALEGFTGWIRANWPAIEQSRNDFDSREP